MKQRGEKICFLDVWYFYYLLLIRDFHHYLFLICCLKYFSRFETSEIGPDNMYTVYFDPDVQKGGVLKYYYCEFRIFDFPLSGGDIYIRKTNFSRMNFHDLYSIKGNTIVLVGAAQSL